MCIIKTYIIYSYFTFQAYIYIGANIKYIIIQKNDICPKCIKVFLYLSLSVILKKK